MILLHVLCIEIIRAPSNLYRSYLYPNPSDARSRHTFTDFIPAPWPARDFRWLLISPSPTRPKGPVLPAGGMIAREEVRMPRQRVLLHFYRHIGRPTLSTAALPAGVAQNFSISISSKLFLFRFSM